jgi:hypothetical protein
MPSWLTEKVPTRSTRVEFWVSARSPTETMRNGEAGPQLLRGASIIVIFAERFRKY